MPRVDSLLSWNMGFKSLDAADVAIRAQRLAVLEQLVASRDVALLALQEAPSKFELQRVLGTRFDIEITSTGVAIGYRTDRWSADYRDVAEPRAAVFGLRPVGASKSLWMFSVHGPALHVSDHDKQEFVRRIGRMVRARRADDGSRLNIVAGDLNLPPFDSSITRKEGLYANRALRWVQKQVGGVDAPLFNPTWILLGRCHDAPGTFYRSTIDVDGPWHACDQLLPPGERADAAFDIAVVDVVGNIRLRTAAPIGAPDKKAGSDHLPIAALLAIA